MINISVLITTLNEEARLPACLSALQDFDEVIVIDSGSQDATMEIADSFGVTLENFKWDGQYPKKRQWCLDHLKIKHDFVFFVDADEKVTPALVEEIKALDFSAAGYFVKGQYIWNGCLLKHGLKNYKLALFNRHKVKFPAVNDLRIEGMGEIEGHYQPVLKSEFTGEKIKTLNASLWHNAYEGWAARHDEYAKWEAKMIGQAAYPKDPKPLRECLKKIFRRMAFRGQLAFLHSYIFKRGFLDGFAGFDFARARMRYYQKVNAVLKTNKKTEKNAVIDKAKSAI